MSRLEEQMTERRQRILEAARAIIGEQGYEALTMRDLARHSRVTVPTIYNLIGNKEQVLLAAVEQQTGSFVSGLRREPGDLLAVIDAAVAELLRMPRYYRALLLVLLTSDAAGPARRVADRALAGELDAALAEIDAAGELAGWVDARLLRERLQAHLDATAIEWARGTRSASSFRAAARFEAALGMLAVSSGRNRERFARVAVESQAEARLRRARSAGPAEARR